MTSRVCSGWVLTPLFILLTLLTGCEAEPAGDRIKPESIPQAAVWVGGADGGVYIHSSQQSEGITIYFENGDVWYSGKQVLTAEQLENATGWDGSTLFFKNGDSLQLME